MPLSFDFYPDPSRGLALDHRMREQLIESLEHILSAVQAQPDAKPDELCGLIGQLRQGGLASPSTFGLYYEAATALLQEDTPTGLGLLAQLGQESLLEDRNLRIRTLDQVNPETRRQRYQRLMDTDPGTPFRIVAPSPATAERDIDNFARALSRLQAFAPELAGEFEAVIREVVLVEGAPDLGYDFAGGSCYMLWGALFINAAYHPDDVAMMEAIAHESGHSLLFGFTIDEPLVLNDDDERFASPLRDDPRPMDGIYHATWVSARMHWTMAKAFASGTLSAEESALASRNLERSCRSFWDGYQTVRASAQMSATGQALMQSAADYMSAFPAKP